MERVVKYLYYRGVSIAKNILATQHQKLKEVTYRGVSMVREATQNTVEHYSGKRFYRGVSY